MMDKGTQRRGPRRQQHDPEPPLLDTFKAAALSLSKLYTGSVAAHAKAHSDGYQDCIEDLLAFLDREKIGVASHDTAKIRRWAADRLEYGRETSFSPHPDGESEDDSDGPVRHHDAMASSPEPQAARIDASNRPTVTTPLRDTIHKEAPMHDPQLQTQFVPPSLDTFTFQSAYPNIGDLDLSDSARANNGNGTPPSGIRRSRHPGFRNNRTNTQLGRGAGSKRKLNLGEIFDIGSLGGKDVFGGGGKRGRYT